MSGGGDDSPFTQCDGQVVDVDECDVAASSSRTTAGNADDVERPGGEAKRRRRTFIISRLRISCRSSSWSLSHCRSVSVVLGVTDNFYSLFKNTSKSQPTWRLVHSHHTLCRRCPTLDATVRWRINNNYCRRHRMFAGRRASLADRCAHTIPNRH